SGDWLFHKRSAPPQPQAPEVHASGMREAVRQRLAHWGAKKVLAEEWLGYWVGYGRLLRQSGKLDHWQRVRLQWMVVRQKVRYQRRRVKFSCGSWLCARTLAAL